MALGLALIAVFWAWIYYLVIVLRYGAPRSAPGAVKFLHAALTCGVMIGAVFVAEYFWHILNINKPKLRELFLMIMWSPGLIWLFPFLFWIDRLSRRLNEADRAATGRQTDRLV